MMFKSRIHYQLLVLLLAFIVVIVGSFIYNWIDQRHHVAEIEQIKIKEFSHSIEQIIALKASKQRMYAYDYSYWDDMAAFSAKPDKQWGKINIDETRHTFDTDFVYIIGPEGRLVYHTPDENYTDIREQIAKTHFDMTQPVFDNYFLAPYEGPVQIFIAPIQKSADIKRAGKPLGYIVVAKIWTSEWVTDLQKITGQKIKLIRLDGNQPKEAYDWVYPLPSKDGSARYGLGIVFDRSISDLMHDIFDTSMYMFLLTGVICIVVAIWFVYRKVLPPLESISKAMQMESAEPIQPLMKKDDEFGHIAALMDEAFRQQNLLIRQSRMAAMGEMIGNIAHQWRQPLNTLGLIVQDIEEAYEHGEMDKHYVRSAAEKAMNQINFMSNTIDDFRNFFNPNNVKKTFSLRNNLQRTMHIIHPSIVKHNITLEISIPEEVQIFGYENEFAQMLLNLIKNGMEAFAARDVPNPRIRIDAMTDEEKIHIRICDNAGGIAEEILEKIFDPYFTTKGEDKGTGIGLYLSKMIIEEHMDGEISVRNTAEGAEFTIILPVCHGEDNTQEETE